MAELKIGSSEVAMGYLIGFVITGLATVLCSFANRYLDHSNLVMIYLLVIVYIATRFGRGPSIFAAVLSVAEFDYFCVQPHYSLAVSDWQYIITFSVMLTIAILITALSSEAQRQNELARLKEDRSEALRALSADLSLTRGREKLVEVALKHIRRTFDALVGIYLPDASGGLCEYTVEGELIKLDRQGNELASWTFQNKQATGLGRGLYSSATSAYLPLIASEGIVGVLQVSPRNKTLVLAGSDEFELLETFANQTALCIEVAALSEQTQLAAMQIEREQLRNALLSSVSHDLRTPLATITGASSSLVEDNASLNESQKQELAQVILEEAEHLNNLVRNLLEMTKLESGPLIINKTWHSIEEIIGACMTRMERYLKDRHVQIKLPRDLPLLPFDDILMQQVLLNLLENAIKYTPEGSDIEIEAKLEEDSAKAQWLCISISDRGPGLKS
ncbi:MAG: DUF4118 domain-containing protein, partial [Candidatus Obscuribacterales bacterium]|nr:DUF4118 domain-containing protein [Candidatus Obscuribacterales bacterium]